MSFWSKLLDATAQADSTNYEATYKPVTKPSMENVPEAPKAANTPWNDPRYQTNDPAVLAARQAAAAADARKLESVVTREDSNGNRIGVTLTRNYQMPKYATDNNGNLKYAAIPQTTQEEVAPEEEAPTPTQTPATKPAPRLLSTPEAIPTTSMEDLPTLADYNKTVSGLASDFSAKLAAARKPFDEAVAKFDQEPSIESVPMSNKDQIRSIRKNARNDIRAIRRGK